MAFAVLIARAVSMIERTIGREQHTRPLSSGSAVECEGLLLRLAASGLN
jgi:hypothetical protein